MNDISKVLETNAAFYRALSNKDMALLESVWSHKDSVKCVHPGWHLIVGWKEVSESWKAIFDSGGLIGVEVSAEEADVQGDIAWVICTEYITHKLRGQVVTGAVQTTNMFERVGDIWLMIHHHASPAPSQMIQEELLQ